LTCRIFSTGDTGRVPYDVPGVVVVDHLDQQVAWEHLLLDDLLLAALDLHDVLHGDVDVEDLVLHLHRLDARLEVRLHLVLVAGVGVDHVPLARPPHGIEGRWGDALLRGGREGLGRPLAVQRHDPESGLRVGLRFGLGHGWLGHGRRFHGRRLGLGFAGEVRLELGLARAGRGRCVGRLVPHGLRGDVDAIVVGRQRRLDRRLVVPAGRVRLRRLVGRGGRGSLARPLERVVG
jgi:hypothetical protein